MLQNYKIFESLNEQFGKDAFVFQQDGASPHRAAATIKFLNEKVKILEGDYKWPANSPDLNVIEILWAIIKSRLDTTNIKNEMELFKEVERIWNEIPIETINLLVKSFYVRLQACLRYNGESLNGKHKFMKNFNTSFEKGNEFIEKKEKETKSIESFIFESDAFFRKLSVLDMADRQCNRLNCAESSKICRILPEKFLAKIDMPKPMVIPKGKVYH